MIDYACSATNNIPVKIYTDGACSGNPGPGGWGVYLSYKNHERKVYGSNINTTNNRMELTATIEALWLLKHRCKVELYTDSQYVQMGITKWIKKWIKNNWKTSNKQLVCNVDLWQSLYTLIQKHQVSWHWVRGHSGNIGNEIADKLATNGKIEAMKIVKNNENTKKFLD
ncbi:ribonuclease H [Orientia tsutsugamushi]|uniref:ribonuclease HI n=1 Tax=Orientia tsutsugamushi TaxID=784 RepID=UPI00061F8C9A|nr:ribonuclease HI [Orientia tsutsugamushi]KJV75867.1 RNase H family protein [Orientia tsutsugamushi str. TA763]SPP24158.1 ribonuclease H [Orientia tsutsugamushi]